MTHTYRSAAFGIFRSTSLLFFNFRYFNELRDPLTHSFSFSYPPFLFDRTRSHLFKSHMESSKPFKIKEYKY